MKVVIDITRIRCTGSRKLITTLPLRVLFVLPLKTDFPLRRINTYTHADLAGKSDTRETGLSPSPETIAIVKNPLHYELLKGIPSHIPLQNYYLWGQYNKFFPVKFAVRYLAYMQIENNQPVPLPNSDTDVTISRPG